MVVFQEAPLGVETRRCHRRGNLCRGDDVQGALPVEQWLIGIVLLPPALLGGK